jgi:hypothetical protein
MNRFDRKNKNSVLACVAYPGSGVFLTPVSGIREGEKIRDPGLGGTTRIHISASFETIFVLKYLNSLMRIRDP